ncbi:MAG: hypothetical protein M1838_003126 [Thelocarpon superellum]|nr:MAG: hypothetical protein M1838_003126 [Thelocarpon superellum]
MAISYLSFPYPPSQPGFWEPVTSTLNWCEEDYYATIYSAEIVNTLTNLLFMFLSFKGLRNCYVHQHDTIFSVAFVGYFLVGLGSFFFHTTLKYPMQLVDELSMIYTTCLMCYATFSFRKSHPFRVVLAISLVGLAIFITLYYHYLQDPAFHQNAYALLTATVVFRSMYIMETCLRPSWRQDAQDRTDLANGTVVDGAEKSRRSSRDRLDEHRLKLMWLLVACGLSVFLGGFGIWALDNTYCSNIRRWRRQIGLPWGILLEGHGWWHLMTGTGAYFYLVWGIWLRHCLNGKQDEYALVWRSWLHLPEIVKNPDSDRQHIDGIGQNGTTKKHR